MNPFTLYHAGIVESTMASSHNGDDFAAQPRVPFSWPTRSFRVFVIVAILVLLNVVDLEFTLLALSHGLLFEANPIASALLSAPAQFVAYKVVLATLGMSMLLVARRTALAELAALIICLVYVILIYKWTACFSLFQAAYFGSILP